MVRLRNLYVQWIVFIAGRDKKLICSSQHPGWSWETHTPVFSGLKARAWSWPLTPHLLPSLGMTGCTLPVVSCWCRHNFIELFIKEGTVCFAWGNMLL
jgi:hypothetical protein